MALRPGCPIRKSQDQGSVTSSPGLIAGSYVLHRLSTPRHPSSALNDLVMPTDRRPCGSHGDTHASTPGVMPPTWSFAIETHAGFVGTPKNGRRLRLALVSVQFAFPLRAPFGTRRGTQRFLILVTCQRTGCRRTGPLFATEPRRVEHRTDSLPPVNASERLGAENSSEQSSGASGGCCGGRSARLMPILGQ